MNEQDNSNHDLEGADCGELFPRRVHIIITGPDESIVETIEYEVPCKRLRREGEK